MLVGCTCINTTVLKGPWALYWGHPKKLVISETYTFQKGNKDDNIDWMKSALNEKEGIR